MAEGSEALLDLNKLYLVLSVGFALFSKFFEYFPVEP